VKRIFIFSQHPLFSRGVETLLGKESGLELVGRETDVEQAIESIRRLEPDIVILDSDYAACNLDPFLIRVLQEHAGIKVVGLNLQNNQLCIFQEEHKMVQCVDDLLSAIRNVGDNQICEISLAPKEDEKILLNGRLADSIDVHDKGDQR
jgi:chemotaxis response regulator CheB